MRLAPILQPLTEPLLSPLVTAITGASGGGFSPIGLFTGTDKGYIYDNNDYVNPTLWRRNLLTYSEQLNVSPWSTSNATVTADQIIAPDGTPTADLITATANGGNARQFFVSSAGIRTFSCYVKKGNVSVITFAVTNISTAFTFNLDTGLVTGGLYQANAFAQDVGNGWYRIGVWLDTVAATNYGPQITLTTLNDTVYAWGFQMEVGSTATTYQRITDFNSDFLAAYPNTTMFVDSAGTQPATVNGLVGLQLDKSGNLALGTELRASGAIGLVGTATAATYNTGTGAGSVSRGIDGSNQSFVQWSSLNDSVMHKITIQNTGAITLNIRSGGQSAAIVYNLPANETITVFALPSSGLITITSATSSATATFTLSSIRSIAGNHRYQATTGSKPILRGTPVGSNLVTNGDFASGTGWIPNTWVISGGSATATNVSDSLAQNISFTAGNVYRVTFTVTAFSGTGGVRPRFFGGTTVTGATRSATGTYVEYMTAVTGNTQFALASTTTTATITVDNVEIVDVSAGAVTAPYGLQYDGIDDFLTTASVDFTATDKMAVVMGVRKLSDAARATVVELANNQINSFRIEAPNVGGTSAFQFGAGGSAGTQNATVETGYPAPITRVVSGIADIVADLVKLRINGADAITPTVEMGTGNFQNAVLYFGRRGGVSQPYNGLDFGGVCIGKSLTATQLANVEKWVSLRTGVTL